MFAHGSGDTTEGQDGGRRGESSDSGETTVGQDSGRRELGQW